MSAEVKCIKMQINGILMDAYHLRHILLYISYELLLGILVFYFPQKSGLWAKGHFNTHQMELSF